MSTLIDAIDIAAKEGIAAGNPSDALREIITMIARQRNGATRRLTTAELIRYDLLRMVIENPGRTAGELATARGRSQGTTGSVLTGLEKDGLVKRDRLLPAGWHPTTTGEERYAGVRDQLEATVS